jgi:E3 ubiquitin-protein ligase synoviolin
MLGCEIFITDRLQASTALAAGVIVYAFNQRSNFYSACVHLSQSNLSLMVSVTAAARYFANLVQILTNLVLFGVVSFMFGLQRLFYGPLRPIELEQLYEKAWFAITETCLAMTIFREEVGAWFLVMFVALLAGKAWGWIGEGRIETLEQRPPSNPRSFHIRLWLSLGLSLAYDYCLMFYAINTVVQQARPNMMVMFLFEFAVLTASSSSTTLKYCIYLLDARIVKQQTVERLAARRAEARTERQRIMAERIARAGLDADGEAPAAVSEEGLPSEDDVDETDIEVPGWEAKGQWVLSLDLATGKW